MLSNVKSFEILPKNIGYGFIYEFFALNLYIFTPLTCKNGYLHCNSNLFFDAVKLLSILKLFLPVVIAVLSYPYNGCLPRTKVYFFFYYQHLLMKYCLHEK